MLLQIYPNICFDGWLELAQLSAKSSTTCDVMVNSLDPFSCQLGQAFPLPNLPREGSKGNQRNMGIQSNLPLIDLRQVHWFFWALWLITSRILKLIEQCLHLLQPSQLRFSSMQFRLLVVVISLDFVWANQVCLRCPAARWKEESGRQWSQKRSHHDPRAWHAVCWWREEGFTELSSLETCGSWKMEGCRRSPLGSVGVLHLGSVLGCFPFCPSRAGGCPGIVNMWCHSETSLTHWMCLLSTSNWFFQSTLLAALEDPEHCFFPKLIGQQTVSMSCPPATSERWLVANSMLSLQVLGPASVLGNRGWA